MFALPSSWMVNFVGVLFVVSNAKYLRNYCFGLWRTTWYAKSTECSRHAQITRFSTSNTSAFFYCNWLVGRIFFFHIRWILCQKWYRRKSNNKIKEKSWTVSLNSQDWSMIVERVNCLALVLDFLSNWSKGNAWIPKPQWFYRLLYSLNWTNREKFAQFFFSAFSFSFSFWWSFGYNRH